MTADNQTTIGPGVKPPILLPPWLVALAALALYGATLNHWVTFASLPFASQLTGWNWHPAPLLWRPDPQYHPLFLIFTFPLRWLPAAWRVIGLNVLTAVCAALTLAILARSVRLLSHDRTKEQRLREGGDFALLSVRAAFLPAAFAVLLLAGQLTFWENAVSGTGEMLDLLVFAFLILCLLEYRVSRSEWRLNLFTFVYGAGVANDWALIGFFPCFLLALIWIKRGGFFNWRFALRMTGWGAAGLLLYGLIPLLGAAHHDGSFWELLHQQLGQQHIYLTRMPRYYAAIAAVPALIPLLFAGINWPSAEGELVAGAHDLADALFRSLHIVFLAVGVLMFFDVKLSASPRNLGMGVIAGAPGFLTFYYAAALSVGYYSGYVLLVFGKEVEYVWGQAKGIMRVINQVMTGLLWVAAIGLPALLFCKDFPRIRDFNGPGVAQFGREMAQSLPAKPAIVLADDSARLHLAMGASQSLGLPDQYVFIDSRSLVHREYLRYLADRYPSFRKELVNPDLLPEEITGRQIGDLLGHLAERQPVYYLHPSFGSYFEEVYMTPRELGGELHPYPTNALVAPLGLSPAEIAVNQAYWHKLEKESLAALRELAQANPDGLPARSADAAQIAGYYSQALDYWGAELQKAGTELKLPALLQDANDQFTEALRLNPNNPMARLNQQFNAHLRGVPPGGPLLSSSDLAAQVGSWDLMYDLYGPVDVPSLNIIIGRYFARNGAYRQAAQLFERCLELAPNNPLAELDLGKTCIDMGLVDAGLGIIKGIPEGATGNPLEVARMEALAYFKKNDFARAELLLTAARAKSPKDADFCGVTAQFYRIMGYAALSKSNGDAVKDKDAAGWFQKALAALDEELKLLNAPMEVMAHVQEISAVNLKRTEMQMMLTNYPDAIATSTAMLQQDPENPVPLLNRAISELQLGRVDAAKNDYQALEKKVPEPSHRVYFGLAQIAQKQNDKPAEIRYDKLYLQYAPTNTAEYTNVTRQLHQLEGR